MTIYEFADIIGKNIELKRFACQDRWIARFENSDISEGRMLCGEYGDAKTPVGAIQSYTAKIRGKRLVFNAGSKDNRIEFNVPKEIKSPL